MAISDYLINNYPQAPKLKPNYAAAAQQGVAQTGGPFAGLFGGILGMKAAHTDAQNAQALQQYNDQKDLASTLINWNRQDELAALARENKTADRLENWNREDALAQRNRQWAQEDRNALWERQDDVAQRQRGWTVADRLENWNREDRLRANATADALEKYAAEQAQKQASADQSRATAQRGLSELQDIADKDSIGAFTRFRNSLNLIGDETRQDLGKISGAVAAIAPMAIERLKNAGVSGVNTIQEFLTYVGLPENPTSQEIAGALPIIRQTLGLDPTQGDKAKLDGYNKKYGL